MALVEDAAPAAWETVTESEWQSCREPQPMLAFLRNAGKLSERKARLFAVAVCRRIATLLPDGRRWSALETCERFADGLADEDALRAARDAATTSFVELSDTDESGTFTGRESAGAVVAGACWVEAEEREVCLFDVLDNAIGLGRLSTGWRNGGRIELRRQYQSLRDLFGPLPFRPVLLPPSVRTCNGGTAARLAQAAYDHRRLPAGTLEPERLAVLADALEEAGCTDKDILGHLREQGAVHIRGCWCIDLLRPDCR